MPASERNAAKLAFRLAGILVSVFVVFLLIVPQLGWFWHLLHGDAISYEGWRVPVPAGFYVWNSPTSPTMWKTTLGIPFFDVPYGHFSLYSRSATQLPFAFESGYSRFEKNIIQSETQSGYQLKSKRTVSTGKYSAYCLEFARSENQPRALVRCVVGNSALVFFYEGDPKYVPDFFATLQGMSLDGRDGAHAN